MTLTEFSYYFRRALPFIFLFGLIFLIIFYSFKLFFIYLESTKPKTTFTNIIFGKIDRPAINEATRSAGFKFTLDTVEGVPVTSTDTAKIYFLPRPVTRFGYREKIYLMARTFGIDTELVKHKLADNLATFDDDRQKLTVNLGNFNFKYENQPDSNSLAESALYIPSKKEIENKATDFLKSIGRYPDELAKGTMRIIYLKYNPNFDNYINVENRKDANLVEVDFYRSDVDGVAVTTPRFFNSQNYVIMLFTKDGYKVIKSQIAFFEKSEVQTGIYPVKSGEAAWQELLAGSGIVVSARMGIKNITIKNMKLYYLDPDIYQTYLQPVYVFYDDKDFVAYVPAITNEYVTE
ncbi:MAG: hypothetical protein US40_C0008G0045 [Candidatus Roizmanbacteria bacterium GW2011_GWC2_37_13]|uniref:Uncharacterized protein n=1 Tax=Candidatus Roizmanbacteria bacterium GW2011_GWC2_37_13 TaxID=1618486 RepID=A0A0G0JB39_9BACT|nr:MAG: hypothetical protein US38_C0003G0045 [Candidatus Roizmanbacteria bacterium GW2011_GWC1_37_12]KKQ25451.1 MAG: hypothetical protein US40_C0008G0045 [Candidatus Roizmanbacteria bacterium GW2011_GWC2_37_13]